MSRPHQEISLAICSLIAKTGSVNYLELEYALRIANGVERLRSLRQHGYIKSLPKVRCELKRYALTTDGEKLIGQHLAEQHQINRNVMNFPKYVPSTLAPARNGAMDAFSISSRGIAA
jgi:hypothetical protein